MRTTHTYARLPLSQEAYDEIADKLKTAGYDHAFDSNGDIDMYGIGVCVDESPLHEALFGSNVLPSLVELTNMVAIPLGNVVRRGFERTGMTIKQWNLMETSLRDVILNDTVAVMRAEVSSSKLSQREREQIAFDSGEGHRCITHDRTNPYDLITRAGEHAAWERGWEKTDRLFV